MSVFGKTLECSARWATVGFLNTQLAPGGLRQGDKTAETLDPPPDGSAQVKPENCHFTSRCSVALCSVRKSRVASPLSVLCFICVSSIKQDLC